MPGSRRSFLSAVTAASYSRVQGANNRVQLGLIGCGLIGLRHLADFKQLADCQIAAVCDAHQARTDQAKADIGPDAKGYQDFRRLLDDKQVDAVVV
jgi:predicted dehydrogenase